MSRLLIVAILVVAAATASVPSAVRMPLQRMQRAPDAETRGARFQGHSEDPVLKRLLKVRSKSLPVLPAFGQRSNGTGVDESPLYSNMFTYWVNVTLGTPGTQHRLIFDTGSSLLWVSGTECAGCNSTDKFNPSSSSTIEHVMCDDVAKCSKEECYPGNQLTGFGTGSGTGAGTSGTGGGGNWCGFQAMYGTAGSQTGAMGYLVSDRAELGGLSADVEFGVASMAQPAGTVPGAGLDGLLGMAFSQLACAPNCVKPLFEELVEQNPGLDNTFTMDMRTDDAMEVVLGSDDSIIDGSMFTPITEVGYYTVGLNALQIGGQYYNGLSYPNDFGMSIVDSGTTLYLLSAAAWNAFEMAIRTDYCDVAENVDVCGHNGMINYSCSDTMTEDQIKLFPTVTLQFDANTTIDIAPEDYFIASSLQTSTGREIPVLCWMFQTTGEALTIIGDPAFRKRAITFDKGRQQVGFTGAYASSWNPPAGFKDGIGSGHTEHKMSTVLTLIVAGLVVIGSLFVFFVFYLFVLPMLRQRRRRGGDSGMVVAYAQRDGGYEREPLVGAA